MKQLRTHCAQIHLIELTWRRAWEKVVLKIPIAYTFTYGQAPWWGIPLAHPFPPSPLLACWSCSTIYLHPESLSLMNLHQTMLGININGRERATSKGRGRREERGALEVCPPTKEPVVQYIWSWFRNCTYIVDS